MMWRFLILISICLVILGALITFGVPFSWVGELPGDLSVYWGYTQVFIPITTSVIFSLVLFVFLSLFPRR